MPLISPLMPVPHSYRNIYHESIFPSVHRPLICSALFVNFGGYCDYDAENYLFTVFFHSCILLFVCVCFCQSE